MTQVLVFGREGDGGDNLLIAATEEDAIQHVIEHGQSTEPLGVRDFEFFDIDGNRLRLVDGDGGKPEFVVISPRDYLDARVGSVVDTFVDQGGLKLPLPEARRRHLENYHAGTEDLATLAAQLAQPHGSAKHTRGPGHAICHLLHLC